MDVQVEQFIDDKGRSPFERWFNKLSSTAAAKITSVISRMEAGNFSNCKSVGAGVWENKLDFGPGYRIYFGKDGNKIVILLCGGTKKKQSNDIKKAKEYWSEYKSKKRSESCH